MLGCNVPSISFDSNFFLKDTKNIQRKWNLIFLLRKLGGFKFKIYFAILCKVCYSIRIETVNRLFL